jgi:arylsulfatase A-like enzyme
MTLASRSAAAFALAWACYAACEVVLGVLLRAVQSHLSVGHYGLEPWIGTALLALYPGVGALLGLAVGSSLAGRSHRATVERALPTLASTSVVVALIGNLLALGDFGKSGVVLTGVLGALAGLALRSAVRATRPGGRDDGWSVLGHPFLLIPLATSFGLITRILLVESPLSQRLGACLALLVVGLAVAAALRGRRIVTHPPRAAAVATACAVLVLLLHLVDHEPPPPLPPPPEPADRPPVVMIVLDTVRADHLGLYGYERATDPNLTAFAERAWVYETAVMPGDMTLSSHASIFTGRWVFHHGTHVAAPVLPEDVTTLAELLRGAGYGTYGVTANCSWIGPGHGIEQGFQYWDARCGRAPFRGIGRVFLRDRIVATVRRSFFPHHASWEWRGAGQTTDEALALLDGLAGARAPFLLFVNYMDVHRPIHPPKAYRELFPGRLEGFDMERDWSSLYRGWRNDRHPTPAESTHLISQYDGALAYLDAQVGRFLDRLAKTGVLDDALVIVTSDHGESFGSHGVFGHGVSVYQDVVRVPFVLKLPGQEYGRRIATPVSGVDILPTVADALGLPLPENVDGRSLLAGPGADRPLVIESYQDSGIWMRGLLRGSTKLVERDERRELYDLASDPDETRDLAAERADTVADLAAALRELELAGGGAGDSPSSALTAEEAARLRALGYLEDH